MLRRKRTNSRATPAKRSDNRSGSKFKMQPLDRAALITMALLSVAIVSMLLFSSRALPRVRTFSWQDKAVSANDIAFLMEFTQPVDSQSVEKNLTIDPPLPGKFSWVGRKMAYTLAVPAPYGEKYEISLPTARVINNEEKLEAFETAFKTRDRIFAYIGVEGEERGRLVMYNTTNQEKTILTDDASRVMNFKPYPERDRILYSATSDSQEPNSFPELYTVSTGLPATSKPPRWQFWRSGEPLPAGTTQKLLDNQTYQNLKFDLSLDGKVIVIQRVNRDKVSDAGPWVIADGKAPQKLETAPSGDFKIAPDSLSLLLQQGKGTAIISLDDTSTDGLAERSTNRKEQADELLGFLPDYGLALDVASDGSAAALVNFNQDDPEKQFTQSLFWVSNRGEEKELYQTEGGVISAQFSDDNKILYGLFSRPFSGEEYQLIPYLSAINVETGEVRELLEMPPQPDITVSLSPDGWAILFDEALASDSNAESPAENSKEAADRPTHRLWLLPLFNTLEERLSGEPIALPATELEIFGKHPEWLP